MNLPKFDNSYARLPGEFFSPQKAKLAPDPKLIAINRGLAEDLRIDPDWLESNAGVAVMAGNETMHGMQPIATKYGGHQFGGWNPRLGDGRALLLGEVIARNGERFDVQLKGSGPTAYSRGGDGLAPLGPVLREFIVSESMVALGVPSTRTLGAVTTGESVFRDVALPGAVLVRVARSHIRVGTFEYFSANGEHFRDLVDHVIDRHFPEANDTENPVLAMLHQVVERQAELIASWQLFGFIHGVMNTDNMLLTGETIDYGPCAFMDDFDRAKVFSSIDRQGRYAYQNQPGIAQWNLAQFARTLVQFLHADPNIGAQLALESLDQFAVSYERFYAEKLCAKFGLSDVQPEDEELGASFFDILHDTRSDFTLAFRGLSDPSVFEFPEAFSEWLQRWRHRSGEEMPNENRRNQMEKSNPIYIPRNHLIEEAIVAAEQRNEFDKFKTLLRVLEHPFDSNPEFARYAEPPEAHEVVCATFCGT